MTEHQALEADEPDPAIAAILLNLWIAAHEAPPAPWSLARLAKRSEVAMSTLRRDLTGLEDAGLAHVFADDKGRDCAALTEAGLALCREAFGEAPPAAAG